MLCILDIFLVLVYKVNLMNFQKAKTVSKARWACSPYPLDKPNDPRYVDLSSLFGLYRGGNNRLLSYLSPENQERPYVHAFLVGPGGIGKTTLIIQNFNEFEKLNLFPIWVDVIDALDVTSICYSDLLLTLVTHIDNKLEDYNITINKGVRLEVLKWFREELLTEEHFKELDLNLQTSGELSAGVPFIGKFLGKILAAFKGGSKYREEIRQRIDRSPNELKNSVNKYLEAATEALKKHFNKDLKIIFFFDNLEKIPDKESQIDRELVNRSTILNSIKCHTVYTIPFSLLIAPGVSGLLHDEFEIFIIPMVKLRKLNHKLRGEVCKETVQRFGELIRCRVEADIIFEKDSILNDLILASGGCSRDLMHITQLACEFAGDVNINEESLNCAINEARKEHLRPAKQEDFDILAKVHLDKQINNSRDEYRLILFRLLVYYNDDIDWYDAHPLICDDPRFKKALERQKLLRNQKILSE